MSGAYIEKCQMINMDIMNVEKCQVVGIIVREIQKMYIFTNDSRPTVLPDGIFNEIRNKIQEQTDSNKKEIPKIMNKTEMDDLEVEFQYNPQDKDDVVAFLAILKPKRCDHYSDWIII